MQKPKQAYFREQLMKWFAQSHRPLPWKGEKDPYLIWLSEIILQQTRVEQGLPYFERFREHYPTVQLLAEAPADEVMKLWEGLGYYSRARNLHAAARYITRELGGRFPDTYEGIRQLKGVGPYTAAAIASFAYGLPYAVVDGNVFRVLSRFFGIETPVDTTTGKNTFSSLAQELLDTRQPGNYNQAIMDFGATQCTPKAPACAVCPLREPCSALHEKKVTLLPVKSKKIEKRQRFFHYLAISHEGKTLLNKRTEKDIWQNLYEFPLLEWPHPSCEEKDIRSSVLWQQLFDGQDVVLGGVSPPYQQVLTHQKIVASFWEVRLPAGAAFNSGNFLAVDQKNLSKFAFPKIISRYLNQAQLTLF
ncbi:MAG: A/G-specific adenine glycosylase [Lewinellaceae bacterium]|nr:A/G-specific adenine glycosylase [Lewinellaceae bacterium]